MGNKQNHWGDLARFTANWEVPKWVNECQWKIQSYPSGGLADWVRILESIWSVWYRSASLRMLLCWSSTRKRLATPIANATYVKFNPDSIHCKRQRERLSKAISGLRIHHLQKLTNDCAWFKNSNFISMLKIYIWVYIYIWTSIIGYSS